MMPPVKLRNFVGLKPSARSICVRARTVWISPPLTKKLSAASCWYELRWLTEKRTLNISFSQ